MLIPRDEGKSYLRNCDFRGLFIELLGWDKATDVRSLELEGVTYTFEAFARKAGVTAYSCAVEDIAQLDYRTRQKLEGLARASFPSHLFVFSQQQDAECWSVWQWTRRELGQPRQLRSVGPFGPHSSFEPILQKLEALAYDIEQENVQAVQVERDLRAAFDVEPVTRRFYTQFEAQYKEFLAAIEGVAEPHQREFASLLLNRLMFLYFMQRKGFLLGETDYLYDRFTDPTKRMKGHDDFFGGFLVPLFFEVLSVKKDKRGGKDNKNAHHYLDVFGEVLYLNGGLFSQRDWERSGKIKVPDEALKQIFEFFGRWNWHLDERPTRAGDEINPDVLGYVFEKFINQKQMGAYYTKEDITGYIARNTILPFLLEKSGLDLERPLQLLRDNIGRYVYPAVAHGCELDLPADIEVGIGDVSQRTNWNKSAPSDYALPTEIWREVVARRARYEALTGSTIRFQLVADLITHNLDIAQWTSDLIADINDAHELERLWSALEEVTILDPTVGSGAFLFAAMGVLGPVYQACLERMDAFVGEAEARAASQSFKAAPSHDVMRATLREIEGHPNRAYAIFKKQAVGNLYGVDIMPEASEICKLRLFLKLAAQVSPDPKADNYGIEPLPDIDFNIRAGNTLVGFASAPEVQIAAQTQINFGATWSEVETEMQTYGAALDNFRVAQLSGDTVTKEAKTQLNDQHEKLVEKLDKFNAGQYQQAPLSQPKKYAEWKASHQPFHWCAEFYTVMQAGGFDVIIGNPPYLEQREIVYKPKGFDTFSTGAVHAMCMERACQLLRNKGALSMIVPLSLVSTQRMKMVQEMLEDHRSVWYANFAWRPGKLFDTVNRALTIFVAVPGKRVYTTGYQMWASEARDEIMFKMNYQSGEQRPSSWIPKLQNTIEESILHKCLDIPTSVNHFVGNTPHKIFYRTTGGLYWKVFTDFAPAFTINGNTGNSSRETTFTANHKTYVQPLIAVLSSDVFWWWYATTSNLRDLNPYDIQNFPVPQSALDDPKLAEIADKYIKDLKTNSTMLERNQRQTGRTATQSFKIQKSKPIIDEIDRVLAKHYGFTDEELDFIINYDIKYRMGRESGDD